MLKLVHAPNIYNPNIPTPLPNLINAKVIDVHRLDFGATSLMKCNQSSNTELLSMGRVFALVSFSMTIANFLLSFEVTDTSNQGNIFTFCVFLLEAFAIW